MIKTASFLGSPSYTHTHTHTLLPSLYSCNFFHSLFSNSAVKTLPIGQGAGQMSSLHKASFFPLKTNSNLQTLHIHLPRTLIPSNTVPQLAGTGLLLHLDVEALTANTCLLLSEFPTGPCRGSRLWSQNWI